MGEHILATIEEVRKVDVHPNADRLELITVQGWSCVASLGQYKAGDKIIYFAVDSVLPSAVESRIFGPDSKVKLKKSRVRCVKIRQAYSKGLPVPMDLFPEVKGKVGTDVTDLLGITKHEAKVSKDSVMYVNQKKKKHENPNFKKVRKPERIERHPDAMNGVKVAITEKIHGCFGGEVRVALADGTEKKISEIVENRLDVEVATRDKNGKITKSRIKNWFKNGRTDDWRKIKIDPTDTGYAHRGRDITIRCTCNHEFFLPLEDRYMAVEEMKEGDVVLHSMPTISPNEFQKQVLIGKMLGDGSLSKSRSIDFGHKKEHEGYVDHTLRYLGEFAGNKQKEQVSGYGSIMCRAKSKSAISIPELFKDWNGKDRKEVPSDIRLTPVSLAFWYMDDGSLSHHYKQKDRACFATCNFSEKSIDNLIGSLKNDLGLTGVKYLSDGEKYWRIRLNKDSAKEMFKIISPYVCDCMKYKLSEEFRDCEPYTPSQAEAKLCRDNYLKECIVRSIETVKQSKIKKLNKTKYDIETEDHNYFANGILVHNSSSKCGYVKRPSKGWKNSLICKLSGDFEFCYRSMNSQLQRTEGVWDAIKAALGFKWKGYYKTNVYAEMVEKYDLKNKIPMGYELAYEIYGGGIQKGYTYGCKDDEHKITVYGVLYNGKNVKFRDATSFCEYIGVPYVPILEVGEYTHEMVMKHTVGKSVLNKKQQVREGCVVETYDGEDLWMGKCLLKSINPAYEAKDQSEFH